MISAAERQKAARERKAAAGLVKLELWLPRHLHDAVRQFVAQLLRS